MLQLLTSKPVLYVCNVEESCAANGNSQSARVAEMAKAQGAASVVISAKIEEEISQLADDEAAMFLEEIGRDYVRTARAKGLDERTVLWKHVFRNALMPIIAGFPAALASALSLLNWARAFLCCRAVAS